MRGSDREFRGQVIGLLLDLVMITATIWLMIVALLSAMGFLAVLWYAMSHVNEIAGCVANAT